ncbi:kinase-like domain-containing protein [Mycena olivaceomarginata]|nr:kinase-like domain-containing protein [Mycena olivaceomarginata]
MSWLESDSWFYACHEIRNGIIHVSSNLLSSAGGESNVVLADVSQTRTIFWPLVRSLASASPEYMGQLAQDPPPILTFHYQYYYLGLFNVPPVSTWSYYDDSKELVRALFIRPVNRIYKALAEGVKWNKKDTNDADLERGQPAPEMPRTTFIVHSVRDTEQADELCTLVDQLKDNLKTRFKSLGIVIVSEPALLRHNSEDNRLILDYFCTMHVSETFVLYSGVSLTPPVLCEVRPEVNSIRLLVESRAERLWPKMLKLSPDDDSNPGELENSTTAILAKLHKAAEGRKQLLECLPDIYFIKRSQILKQQAQDNIKIAHRLEQLFELNYRKEIAGVPREHAISVLNLTYSILDGVLPKNDVIKDAQQFSRRAHRLLNLLAAQLKLLPEELAVKEVVLLSEHPIKHGGFSNIYHGRYKNPDGEHQEVALKVLKIFEDQSDDRRNLLHDKFTKEALFIGVDSTTFPSPARAMVSPWMAQGSVLKYIAETSPVAPYAVELLNDVIKGLKYLHSVNIVHGDLCGRNILIDARGRACLTDFGLAAFVESDVTIKSSTRSGSVRWMAPELLSPPPGVSFRRTTASDLWAFGCVCGEIWTEGTAPFSHLSHEMGIIFAFSDPTNSPAEQPYHTRPSDKRGTLMPDRLWKLAQWCWKYDASERPAVQVVADMLAEMRRQKNPNALLLEEEDDDAPPVASSSGTRHVGSETSSSANSVEYEAPPSSSHVSSADAVDDNLSSIVASAKGKQRVVHFEDESPAVVRFGPLLLTPDSDYEDAFFKIFEMLSELVSRRALVEPRSIHPCGREHIDLHFRNELEANSFAMTWTVHRFEPYLECNAALIDAD